MKLLHLFSLFICCTFCTSFVAKAKPLSDVERIVQEWMAAYRAVGIPMYHANGELATDVCKPVSVTVNDKGRTITVVVNEAFASQQFTSDVVANIYSGLQQALGRKYEAYKLNIRTKNYPIEQLVPFSALKNTRRSFKAEYKGRPWVQNTSRPITFKHGLQGRHIALWASHGLFWKSAKKRWQWQRPYLFTTCEDILTPGVVNQLLIPMLENAGAIVYTPRERDWQTHEAIADNDTQGYREYGEWQNSGAGFGWPMGTTMYQGDNPFSVGTVRSTATTRDNNRTSRAVWTPVITVSGDYAVYVSYKTLQQSVSDAQYTVRHAGIDTQFSVNQQMGGSTWVYLGTFHFTANNPEDNNITLSNYSESKGVVTADAVRLGGGMGCIDRGGGVSGVSRYFEGARYSMQWAGMDADIYTNKGEDYADDINTRSLAINYLSGGSVYNPYQRGLGVPFELSLACHTDAGATPNSVHGTLGINTTKHKEVGETVAEGASRLTSRDMAQMVMQQVASDLSQQYGGWQLRQLWDRNYSETRLPVVPSMILEMLSHQSFADMRLMHDPTFKFSLARAIYKGILRYAAVVHGQKEPIIQPLPVTRLAALANAGKHEITVQWHPVNDPLEPSAKAAGYIVYTRLDGHDFDNGHYTTVPRFQMTAQPGVLYSFRVSAVNAGGESMPSETVCALISPHSANRSVLIMDGFQRLAGPQVVQDGFDIVADPGVPYMATPSICGVQTDFGATLTEVNSSNELEGRIVVGNTRDIAFQHGASMTGYAGISISSCTRCAAESGDVQFRNYNLVDLAMGQQRADGYSLLQTPVFTSALIKQLNEASAAGTNLLLSGAYIGQDEKNAPAKILAQSTAAEIFKYNYTGSIQAAAMTNVAGMNTSCTLFQPFDTRGAGVPSADALYSTGVSFTCMLYEPTGQSAAVAYAGGQYNAMTFGFPLEAITNAEVRQQIMHGVLRFLLK